MNKKLGQEPAFANVAFDKNGIFTHLEEEGHYGMSKRFYAACAAMQALISNPNIARPGSHNTEGSLEEQYKDFSKRCFEYADALLEQENE